MGLVADELYEALGHFRRKDTSGDLLVFCEAWAEPLERVYEIVRDREDGEPGWAILLSADECPVESLPYLAQFVGAVLTPDMDEAQMRAELREPSTWRRGRRAAVILAPKPTLTGTKKVIVRPATPEPGIHYIRTLKSETPDEERTRAKLRAALPAWEVLDYEAFDGYTYSDLDAGFETYAAVDAEFDSYGEILEADLP
jgi:hypothetical protein